MLYDFQIAPNPMYVRHAREIPEYEIDPKELDFTNSVEIDKVKILIDVFHIVLSQCSDIPSFERVIVNEKYKLFILFYFYLILTFLQLTC